jgi:hypothetical protein
MPGARTPTPATPGTPSQSGPIQWLRQHATIEAPQSDDIAFRPYFRKVAPLDKLLRDRLITPPEHRAAVEFRRQ